jgi:hypothetical protein
MGRHKLPLLEQAIRDMEATAREDYIAGKVARFFGDPLPARVCPLTGKRFRPRTVLQIFVNRDAKARYLNAVKLYRRKVARP